MRFIVRRRVRNQSCRHGALTRQGRQITVGPLSGQVLWCMLCVATRQSSLKMPSFFFQTVIMHGLVTKCWVMRKWLVQKESFTKSIVLWNLCQTRDASSAWCLSQAPRPPSSFFLANGCKVRHHTGISSRLKPSVAAGSYLKMGWGFWGVFKQYGMVKEKIWKCIYLFIFPFYPDF